MAKLNLNPITFPCPAKLNLFLYITGQRADGYHQLQTLFQFLDYGDDLTIQVRTDGEICLKEDSVGIPSEKNLIYRSAKLLQKYTQCSLGADLELYKRLPMGGGLGGGSSNAGTTLVALNKLWEINLPLSELAQLGLNLGADVPIFVQGKSAFAEGIGEQLTFCQPQEKWYVVLNPNLAINTGLIFNHPDLPRNRPQRTMEQCLVDTFTNDCENLVKKEYPLVEELVCHLLKYAPARLTGTGSCVFAEFAEEKFARLALNERPVFSSGFVAQGKNISPLHQFMQRLEE